MVQRQNKDNQWKTVIQGVALGVLNAGFEELPGDKMSVEFAFAKAWRSWPSASEFPSVSPRDFFIYARKSPRRNSTYGAFDWNRTLVPYVTIEGWTPAEALETFTEDERISQESWRSIGATFASELLGSS